MTNDRKRISLSEDYAGALGTAIYCFAVCEWNVVWCCERINSSELQRIVGDEMTAGKIGKRFHNLVGNMSPSPAREQLAELAGAFLRLVEVRNSIIHGKPCTASGGEQRLSSQIIWEIVDLQGAADEFSKCSIKLNQLLHGFLSTYKKSP